MCEKSQFLNKSTYQILDCQITNSFPRN
uniref:Uncharacterized protein n=1 Tax=Anguilla anguilla TaxID=7936 RepID=A0A0E9TLD2_ANGAN